MRKIVKKLMGIVEVSFIARAGRSKYPPLFILGLPRSGTTLIYQYIIHRLDVSYFTNGVEEYFTTPALVTWWRFKRFGRYHTNFNSNYGEISGPNAPSESGNFWAQFFGYDDYVQYGAVDAGDETIMQRTVAKVELIFGSLPFVNKNVKHLLRIDALSHIFPKACFVVIHRELKDVVLSLLRGRYANLGQADQWWSVRPPNYRKLAELPPPEQIAQQVIGLQKRLFEDLRQLPEERVLEINYDNFCENPEGLIQRIRLIHDSFRLRDSFVKSSFKPSYNEPETAEEKRLIANLSKLQAHQ